MHFKSRRVNSAFTIIIFFTGFLILIISQNFLKSIHNDTLYRHGQRSSFHNINPFSQFEQQSNAQYTSCQDIVRHFPGIDLTNYSQSCPLFLPINELLFKVAKFTKTSRESERYLLENTIRSGAGLAPHFTEDTIETWVENGVIYLPFAQPKGNKLHPSPFTPEFEPYIPFNEKVFFESAPFYKFNQSEKKIILWWPKTRYAPPMNDLQPMRFCPEFPCVITTNQRYKDQSAAMVFPGQLIRGKPPSRRHDQVFIFSNHEPPHPDWFAESHVGRAEFGWKDVFNWTMTYRLDSDVTSFYGLLRRRRVPIKRDYAAIVANKTKAVAWIVSNCHTMGRRESYVKELSKHIQVDVFGACSNLKCPRNSDDECFQLINTTYKFYLSFESNFCKDYISEKFFRYISANTITVARGDNSYHLHAPKETFINTADYRSPKELADRLNFLDKNNEEYIRFLQEKDKYVPIYEDYPIRNRDGRIHYMHYHYEAVPFCEVCQRLWNLDKYAKTIVGIDKWVREGECVKPKDLNF